MNKPATGGQEELRAFLERYPATQILELLQPDMLGVLRGKRVVRAEFAKPFKDGVNFCGATVLLDSKGQTFERIDNGGRDGDPDVISTAVPGSLAPVPWAQVPTAQVLLAMNTAAGEPFFADPRQVLRHAMRPLAGARADGRRRHRARVLSARVRGRPALAESRPHPRHPEAAGRTAVRQHGGRRGRRPLSRGAVLGLCGAEHPGRGDAQGVLPRAVRGQPPPCPERGTRLRSRGAAEARGQGGRATSRPRRELHGEAVRGRGRLQPARPCQPHRQVRSQRVRRAVRRRGRSPTRCVTWSAGSRPRWARPWRSSRRPRTRIGVTGPVCSCR